MVSFIFGLDFCFSQTAFANPDLKIKYTESEIDSLQDWVTVSLRSQGKFQELIELNKELILISEKRNYDNGIIRGYIHIANALYLVGKYNESLRFLKLAQQQKGLKKDNYLQSWLYTELGNNLNVLGFAKNSMEAYSKAVYYAKGIPEPNYRRTILSYSYNKMAICKYFDEMPDSTLYYLQKSRMLLPEHPQSTTNVGDWFMDNGNIDSAWYYLGEADKIIGSRTDFLYERACLYWSYADLYSIEHNYIEALKSLEKSQAIFKDLNQPDDLIRLYNEMARIYDNLKIPKKREEYFLKHILLKDSLNNLKQPALDTTVFMFLEEQEKENINSGQRRFYYTIAAIFTISLLFVLLIIHYYRKNKRKSVLIEEKKFVIEQKDKETEALKQKVNEGFEEIIQLAKKNSPEFWGRFQEIYPEFCERILEMNSHLKTSELTLCAYIYLGFNTKDIAEYTFKAVQTVKNNKHNLRRRLNVPPQEDIMIWIRNHIDS